LASELEEGGKRDLLVLLLRDVLDNRPDRVLVPIFHRAKPHPDWGFDPLRYLLTLAYTYSIPRTVTVSCLSRCGQGES